MSKFLHDDVLDALLNYIANNGNKLTVCSTQPTTYTEATSTYKLVQKTLTVGNGNGDYTIANGDVSGRKLTVSQQSSVPIDSSGTAGYIAICDSTHSKLLLVTTCTSEDISGAEVVTIPSFKTEVADPS